MCDQKDSMKNVMNKIVSIILFITIAPIHVNANTTVPIKRVHLEQWTRPLPPELYHLASQSQDNQLKVEIIRSTTQKSV